MGREAGEGGGRMDKHHANTLFTTITINLRHKWVKGQQVSRSGTAMRSISHVNALLFPPAHTASTFSFFQLSFLLSYGTSLVRLFHQPIHSLGLHTMKQRSTNSLRMSLFLCGIAHGCAG